MVPLSVLDLVPVSRGSTAAEALDSATKLAQTAESLGYKRYWVAEHHAMDGVAAAATSVVLTHIANATKTIRVGSGGVMLPNHNPLVIAEQFGTLDALFPGRIDLGLGRAPGADGRIAQAMRKDIGRAAEHFPHDVLELRALFTGEPELPIRAVPGHGADVEMWMLGSSLFGASLAAKLGLPYAFASHFAPDMLDRAIDLYRQEFVPSAQLAAPYVMVAMNVFAAPTLAEAELIASTQQQAFVALRTGNPGKLPPPVAKYLDTLPSAHRAMLENIDAVSAIGDKETIGRQMAKMVERTGADEIILSGPTHDPAARRRSLEITMDAARIAA